LEHVAGLERLLDQAVLVRVEQMRDEAGALVARVPC